MIERTLFGYSPFPLIPVYVLAVVFFCAAFVAWRKKQYEHFITRLLVAVFYCYLIAFPNLPLEWTRAVSRYIWFLLGFIEVLSAFVLYVQRRREKL